MTSVPENTPVLDLNTEFHLIDTALERSVNARAFRLFRHARLRREELEKTLAVFQPHVVHFSGHSNSRGYLLLEDAAGDRWELDRDTLRTIFKAYGQSVKLAVLNACHSEIAGNTLREVVPYVIGNSIAVYDSAAVKFAETFYDSLFQGESLHLSFRNACNAVGSIDPSRAHVPQLLTTPLQPDPRKVRPLNLWASPGLAKHKAIAILLTCGLVFGIGTQKWKLPSPLSHLADLAPILDLGETLSQGRPIDLCVPLLPVDLSNPRDFATAPDLGVSKTLIKDIYPYGPPP